MNCPNWLRTMIYTEVSFLNLEDYEAADTSDIFDHLIKHVIKAKLDLMGFQYNSGLLLYQEEKK